MDHAAAASNRGRDLHVERLREGIDVLTPNNKPDPHPETKRAALSRGSLLSFQNRQSTAGQGALFAGEAVEG